MDTAASLARRGLYRDAQGMVRRDLVYGSSYPLAYVNGIWTTILLVIHWPWRGDPRLLRQEDRVRHMHTLGCIASVFGLCAAFDVYGGSGLKVLFLGNGLSAVGMLLRRYVTLQDVERESTTTSGG